MDVESTALFSQKLWSSAVAQYFMSLPLHPFFSIVHFISTAIALREEPGGLQFARKHPIASCIITFVVASSGGILANLCLARPPVACLLEPEVLVTCTIVWFLIFFSPFDFFFDLCHLAPFNLLLLVIKELARAKKVFSGVQMAASVYPTSKLAMALVGMLKGSGKQWGITWYRLFSNSQTAHKHELLEISNVTKSAFALGLLLAYNHTHPIIDHAYLVLAGGCALVVLKRFHLKTTDAFAVPQGLMWSAFTCFSTLHPVEETGPIAKETDVNKVKVKTEDRQKKLSEHLKDD